MTELKKVNEAAIDANVSTTDENLSFEHIYQQTPQDSLAKYILSESKLHGPTGALFNFKNVDGSLVLLRNEVQVFSSEPFNTFISKEMISDLYSQYGVSAYYNMSNMINGISNTKENVKLHTFLNTNSLSNTALDLTSVSDIKTRFELFSEKVNSLILKMNDKTVNTLHSFVVVPKSLAPSIATIKDLYHDSSVKTPLYIGTFGLTHYFINPFFNDEVADTTAYVGLKDPYDLSKSSGVYSPYVNDLVTAVDAHDGSEYFHVFKRYAMTVSPLHSLGNELFQKFDVAM